MSQVPKPTPLRLDKRLAIGAAGVAAVIGVGWMGLRVKPGAFPPFPAQSRRFTFVTLPSSLPDPVSRYFGAVLGGQVPVITSAVVTGRGRLRFSGLTFPCRFRFSHLPGRDYRHYIECTWFGYPVLRVNEWYVDGHARLELPFGVVADEPKVDQAANLNLWGEAVWFPSTLTTDPRVRWHAIDATTAGLTVPLGDAEESSTVVFDPQTGLIRSMLSWRYRLASDETRTPERFDALDWRTFHSIRIPSRWSLTWLDQGTPWLVGTIEDVAYNVDLLEYLRGAGP